MAKKPKDDSFAARLRTLRAAAGHSQYRLAKLCGVSSQALGRLEHGMYQPTWETVCKIADALGVPVETFRVPAPSAPK